MSKQRWLVLTATSSIALITLFTPADLSARLITATPIPFSHSVGSQPESFRIVRGDGYEGAIVPAASPWHKMFRIAIIREGGSVDQIPSDVVAWTPEPADIEATERSFAGFLARAAKEPSKALATLPPKDRGRVKEGLDWLILNVRTLKRQYWGFETGGTRRIAVHGAPDDPDHRWRTRSRAIMDGGCGNFWLDFNLTDRRIVRFTCGGSA